MTLASSLTGASLLALVTALAAAAPSPALAADALLTGAIASAAGDKLGGVAVSAKQEGSTITTTVYTDETGSYYFPPLPAGKYNVWAQAIKFETGKGKVELTATRHQDFKLQPMKDQEDWVRQLPGDEFLAALPDATPEDARMKVQVRKNCTGCHSASYPLQHRFDEAGWTRILDLMKHVNVLGTFQGPDHKASPNIDFHQKDLAAYLARARGPGETSMTFKLRPRPSGEAARVVFREYDFPMEGGHTPSNDGSDWSLGTPSGLNHLNGVHDAQADFDGNIWFTYAHPGYETTVGRIDAKTGATKSFRLDDVKGFAIGSHGITRDENGNLWFNTRSNVQRAMGGLAKIDPKAEKITVYLPPRTSTGTAGTLDADLKGNVWVTMPDGAFRFDIAKETFTEFKSVTYKNELGTATVYGLAADRTGNAWWLLMQQDRIDFSDISTGKASEISLQPDKDALATLSPAQTKMYESFVPPDFNTPFAWAQAPRRMGADKNGDFVWVGNSFGGNLAKINIFNKDVTYVPLPNPESQQPYQVAVDKNHNVWTHLWSTDLVAKYDQGAGKWTLFDLPTRGTETRHISLLEREGQPMQVVIPYSRTRKVAVMTARSEADLQALKAQASQ
jgi:streptogramin lyase